MTNLSVMQTGHKRFASSMDGEEFIEELSESKRQRIGKSTIRFYHEPIVMLPSRLQNSLTSLVSFNKDHLETCGKLCDNGQIQCAINGSVLFWRIPYLCEFYHNFDDNQVWCVPYPPAMATVNPDLVAVVGVNQRDVYISTTSGTVYYLKYGCEKYNSVSLPLRNSRVIAIYPYGHESTVVVLSSIHEVFVVSAQEVEEDSITDTFPFKVVTRIVESLSVRCLSKGFESLMHSIWTTIFGSSSPTICHSFSYPYLLLVNDFSLQLLNVESGKFEIQQNLGRSLPDGNKTLRIWFDGCETAVLFTRSSDEKAVFHIYLCVRNKASFVFTKSALLPFVSWLDSPYLQLSVSLTVDGYEAYLLNPLAQPYLMVASLYSTPSITTYIPHLSSSLLFASSFPPMPGLLFVTSTQCSRFVAETPSSPSMLDPECLIPCTPDDLQNLNLPEDVLQSHLIKCCKLFLERCFYTCAALYSTIADSSANLKSLLFSVIEVFYQRADTASLISLIDLCCQTRLFHFLQDSLPQFSNTISHVTLCDYLHQKIDTDEEEALKCFSQSVEDKTHTLDLLKMLIHAFQALSFNKRIIDRCIPEDVNLPIATWLQHDIFIHAVTSLIQNAGDSLHNNTMEDNCVIPPRVFVTCCKETIMTYIGKEDALVHLCFNYFGNLQLEGAIQLAQSLHYYSFLAELPIERLLILVQADEELAKYCLSLFAVKNSVKAIKVGLLYPELAREMLASKPELLWRVLIQNRASCEEILRIIKQISNKTSQIEALSHLWLLAKSCKESDSILNEIDQCRLAIGEGSID